MGFGPIAISASPAILAGLADRLAMTNYDASCGVKYLLIEGWVPFL